MNFSNRKNSKIRYFLRKINKRNELFTVMYLCVYPSIVDNPKLQNHSVLNNSSTYTLKIEKPKCRNPREKEKIEPLGEVFFLKMFMVSEKLSNSQLPSLRRQNQYLRFFGYQSPSHEKWHIKVSVSCVEWLWRACYFFPGSHVPTTANFQLAVTISALTRLPFLN